MANATDEALRRQVHRLAPRLLLDRARTGRSVRRGTGRPRHVPASRGGDLDVDASLDAVAAARAERRPPNLDDLVARDWGRPDLALCLLVDRSGSMHGARRAT
jgi:Mg-chelatase subunit ChlD